MPRRNAQQRLRFDQQRRPNAETSLERAVRLALEQRRLVLWFEEQAAFGIYRADFVIGFRCCKARMVIECDGPVHERPRQQAKDRRKDAMYRRQGYAIARLSTSQIRRGALACVDAILKEHVCRRDT